MKKFHRIRHGQSGFTLLELLVSVPLAALVVAAATAALIPILKSSDASTHMMSLREVQTAGYWVSTDGMQAESVDILGDNTTAGFPFVLEWADPDTGETCVVQYDLVASSGGLDLQRTETVSDTETGIPKEGWPHTTIVARYVTQATANLAVVNPNLGLKSVIMTFSVSAQVGNEPEETRTYQIRPRSFDF